MVIAKRARYWSSERCSHTITIVAFIGERLWSAYIGVVPRVSEIGVPDEEIWARIKLEGFRLSEKDARHFFPDINLLCLSGSRAS